MKRLFDRVIDKLGEIGLTILGVSAFYYFMMANADNIVSAFTMK